MACASGTRAARAPQARVGGRGTHRLRAGFVYRGVNTSLLDGFDVAFTKLVFGEMLGAAVEYYPYPDTSSLCVTRSALRGTAAALTRLPRGCSYVGLRNDECDVAAAAVELDPGRATCSQSCPDTSVTPLQDLPGSDYVLESYRDRLDTVCACRSAVCPPGTALAHSCAAQQAASSTACHTCHPTALRYFRRRKATMPT